MMRIAVCLILAASLLGCGKRGNPAPPGPADQISYPKSYPTR